MKHCDETRAEMQVESKTQTTYFVLLITFRAKNDFILLCSVF